MRGAVAVTGIGHSAIGRSLEQSEGQLAVESGRAALADAGLAPSQVDGLVMFPVRTSPPTPFQGPGLPYVQRSLGLDRLAFRTGTTGEMGQFAAIMVAAAALSAGLCRHCLVYRAHKSQARGFLPMSNAVDVQYDEEAFTVPYGGGGGTARMAAWAARHMHEFGTTQEQLGSVCVTARAYAAEHPRAYWDTPITIEEYLDSRWLSTPFKILDCDIPVDGSTALVLSRSDAVGDTSSRPVYIEAASGATGPDTSWSHWQDKTTMTSRYVAEDLWSRTSVKPNDVDVAQLYDGFSWLAIAWLEDLGFVPKGAGGPFFADGGGTLDGQLPINTDGGQLGGGRLHGFGRVAEAAYQLRGEAFHQVPGAEIAIASAGAGPGGAAILLTGEQRAAS